MLKKNILKEANDMTNSIMEHGVITGSAMETGKVAMHLARDTVDTAYEVAMGTKKAMTDAASDIKNELNSTVQVQTCADPSLVYYCSTNILFSSPDDCVGHLGSVFRTLIKPQRTCCR